MSVGDKVLVRRVAFDGKHMIQATYKDDVYTVVSQKNPDIPLFTVRSGDIEKTLHRNLLYLLDLHEDEVDEADVDEKDEAADADKHADVDDEKEKDVIKD